jgi:hypothetical protein
MKSEKEIRREALITLSGMDVMPIDDYEYDRTLLNAVWMTLDVEDRMPGNVETIREAIDDYKGRVKRELLEKAGVGSETVMTVLHINIVDDHGTLLDLSGPFWLGDDLREMTEEFYNAMGRICASSIDRPEATYGVTINVLDDESRDPLVKSSCGEVDGVRAEEALRRVYNALKSVRTIPYH